MVDSFVFRYMKEEDIDQILEVEHASFATPWSREAFYNEIYNNKFAVYIVLEEDEKIIGYVGAWVVIDEAHVTNLAILPSYRGKKLGEALLRKMMTVAKDMGARSMTLEVRVTNNVAQSLYRKLGFQNGGIRKNYYTDNQEDALVMWVNI
ncbi:ribosomal-protein-alanine N-acetyltransferase [Bacillus niacini]|jgi:[ribosomal protein S18]-alanine N-acetyltransferase|uniref:[Ribosomal protein bS18]-alanine N-acetyltransferase n=2 Tax=Neobacillus TaxID=2675232 RepID=A0A852TKQ4_9BACI|nr:MULTISPECIES: ribosomal protein S18-alanine N-acetyltransferase [Neobacillus]MDP5197890.1 ribosomal protein S18-alanine N-acetyltransferase [Neobacillus sp. 179.-C4.2 HS]MDQ0976718.1 ribosomal-protein-alanine N-acetyltransferase [Neobacillus niacini]NYE09342.1 ribosomal-protein-alanine N-acetyltransferase [Neobacillus niacini]